jgi:hypothetical protein
VANTFQEQAKDRFRRSEAFLRKAQALIQDDLIYRSALADAVSAIKNMLQGYLSLQIASSMPNPRIDWQEIAASNRMPDLLRACSEAGLNLRGVERNIRRLNTERNQRTHDDPQYLIDPTQAEDAVALALEIHKRIRDALRGRQQAPAAVALPQRHAAFGRPPVAPAAAAATATPAAAVATAPSPANTTASAAKPAPLGSATANGTAAITPPSADLGLSGEDASEDDEISELPTRARRRERVRRVLRNVLVAVLLLIVGAAAGIGLVLPVASGYAPGLLAPVVKLLPSTAAGTPTAAPLATAIPTLATSGPLTLGTLAIGAPTCSLGTSSLQLTNNGTAGIRWAVSSVEASGARFSLAQADAGTPAQFGTLAAATSATLYITNTGGTTPYRVVFTSDAGAVQVVVAAC